jgi:hypothetical protein
MASTISAITTGGGGIVQTADASGNLSLLSGDTTIVAMTATGATVTGALDVTGVATLGTGAILGTPASGNLSNCTGFPSSTSATALFSGATTIVAATATGATVTGTLSASGAISGDISACTSTGMVLTAPSLGAATATSINTPIIKNAAGAAALDVAKLATGGRYTRQIIAQVDSATYNVTAGWAVGPTFAQLTDMKAGSLIKMSYTVPCRNDSTSWGGMYIEPQINIAGAGWQSLGSCGYDGNVMNLGNAAIGTYTNSILITPSQAVDFTVQFRLVFRTYDGAGHINYNHDVNVLSGTAPLMAGDSGLQHFLHIIVEELAILRGAA